MKGPDRDCRVRRGARVIVREPNRRPWDGEVLSVKWSRISGWWADVREDGGTMTIVLPQDYVEEVEQA